MTTPLLEEIDMTSVSTSPLVKTYTLDEFWRLPDPPDRSKLELIAGVLYMTPPPDWPRLNELLSARLRSTGTQGTLYVPAPPCGRARAPTLSLTSSMSRLNWKRDSIQVIAPRPIS